MYLSDYHIHSNFSGDSVEDLENIIKKAKELELKEIAITDHMDLDTGSIYDSNFILDLNKYIPRLLELKERERKNIDIKIGMEFGIQRHLGKEAEKIIKNHPFDFVISSIHSIDKILIDKKEYWSDKTKEEGQEKYFLEVLNCIKSYDTFSVQGHLDFISRYGGEGKKGFINYAKYDDIIDEILKELIDKGKGIEINTSGIRYLENRFYPCNSLVKRYFDLGGEIITIGSDSHRAIDICKNFSEVYDFLENINIKYISSFDKMKVEFKKFR